jgi:hypothetical protein
MDPAGVYPREGGGWGFDLNKRPPRANPLRLAAQALAQWEADQGNRIRNFIPLKTICYAMGFNVEILKNHYFSIGYFF